MKSYFLKSKYHSGSITTGTALGEMYSGEYEDVIPAIEQAGGKVGEVKISPPHGVLVKIISVPPVIRQLKLNEKTNLTDEVSVERTW